MDLTGRRVPRSLGILAIVAVLVVAACDGDGGSAASTMAAPTTRDSLPDNAAGYAQAAFEAWLVGESDRMQQLMTADAYQVLADRTPSDDDRWGSGQCEGAAGSTYCQWSGSGDNLVLRVENEAASSGDAQAIIEARFE